MSCQGCVCSMLLNDCCLLSGDCHLCRVLLEKPQQPDGKGALHAAARYGHAEVESERG